MLGALLIPHGRHSRFVFDTIYLYDTMWAMEIRFARTARRHRIGKAHALAAMNNAGNPIRIPALSDDLSDQLVWIGSDDRGVQLEVIAVERPDCLLVIHVMPTAFR